MDPVWRQDDELMRKQHQEWQHAEELFWRYASPEQKQKRREQEAASERAGAIFGIVGTSMFFVFWFTLNFGSSLLNSYLRGTPFISIIAVTITLFGAIGFWYLREKNRRWYIYPLIELIVSACLATAAVAQSNNKLLSILSLLGAVRVAVDGINRLIIFWKEAHPPSPLSLPLVSDRSETAA